MINLRFISTGIELDVRRYIAALLAALHLARVTSMEQKREQEQEKQDRKDSPAEPAPVNNPPQQDRQFVPTTRNQVKSTPEGKSTVVANNSQ